jgi:2-polyprenyl-6-methoxyphenol hydroxylase-like FAD-dependent oxidoreductase
MRALVVGAGIAGPTLAYWLVHYGVEVTLLEKSPALRRGGYVVDFWGTGLDVADRMGLLPDLQRKGYRIREVRIVDREGRRVSGFSAGIFRRATRDRYLSIPRGELAASIYGAIEERVETMFGDGVAGLEERDGRVHVAFERAPPRQYDLVFGADGLHSSIRALTFGPETRFERYLGHKVAAFAVSGYQSRDEDIYVMHTEVRQQAARFSMRDDRTMFLFVFADADPTIPSELAAQKAILRRRYRGSGWECPRILEALDGADEVYLDRVSQIRMEQWTRGRVALVGDAAFCPSLLAGQGSALAMAAAYVLAGELSAARGDHRVAFARYHERLADFIAGKQTAAEGFTGFFAPRSQLRLFLQNQITKLLAIPLIGRLAVDRQIADKLALPDYGQRPPLHGSAPPPAAPDDTGTPVTLC